MSVAIRADLQENHARLVLTGPFDLAHAMAVTSAVENVRANLRGCVSVDVDLGQLDHIDGAGAVLLARLFDRLASEGREPRIVHSSNRKAAQLIARYRKCRGGSGAARVLSLNPLSRIGAIAAELPDKASHALDFTGRFAASFPKVTTAPTSVDWSSLPRLIQEIGAEALPVTSAANLLVGIIIGLLGASQLAPLGAVTYVPGLVLVAHFRELGPLVTAIVVAGRSGAGLASEIATMKVSEEIDALKALGFDPVRWLVVPRCLALAITLPLLTLIGDLLALIGGLAATTLITNMTLHAYVEATADHVTATHLFVELAKSPFLALAIGMVACGQGLATRGGAAAVGSRTTTAVVQSIFSVIVISAVFTFFSALIGI